MRFGLIGCGAQGRHLSDALSITGSAELVACMDVKLEAAEGAAKQCGYGETYSDLREMLSKAEIDAVIVATTHDQLQPSGMAVVEAGKHLFIESPMALNAGDGRRLVEVARQAAVKVMVGFTLPFLPERIRMKQLLERGAVGEIVHINAGQLVGPWRGWMVDPARGGGPLRRIGSQVIHQVFDVIGRKAERVYAEVDFTESGVDASSLFTIRFEGGIAAQMTTSQRMGGRYGWIDIIGSDGLLRSEWESNQLVVQSRKVPEYKERTTIDVEATATGPATKLGTMASVTGFKYVCAWAAEFMEFIAAIQEDRDPRVTGEDAVRVLEICDAVIESGRAGRAVEL